MHPCPDFDHWWHLQEVTALNLFLMNLSLDILVDVLSLPPKSVTRPLSPDCWSCFASSLVRICFNIAQVKIHNSGSNLFSWVSTYHGWSHHGVYKFHKKKKSIPKISNPKEDVLIGKCLLKTPELRKYLFAFRIWATKASPWDDICRELSQILVYLNISCDATLGLNALFPFL